METKAGLLLVFVVLALSAATTNATIVTIGLTAEITNIDRYSQWLNENFKVGDIITGRYTYNTDTPDLFPSNPRSGVYWHYDRPYGISLNANGYTIQSNPDDVMFLVGTFDRPDGDCYLLESWINLPISNGILADHISWQLDDESGTALSSDILPTTAPVLGDWGYDWGLRIYFGYKGGELLVAKVTSVENIPEPTTLLFFVWVGTVVLVKRKR
jgi:hypothetical protein